MAGLFCQERLRARRGEATAARPPRKRSKRDLALDPEAPAGHAFLALHRRLFDALQRNEPEIRQDRGSEPLHRFRVAARRIRVLYRIFRDELQGSEFEALGAGYRELGRITTPTRDLDVQLMDLRRHAETLGVDAPALAPVAELLRRQRDAEWGRLVAALESEVWRGLEARTEALLDRHSSPARELAQSGPALRPWASQRISRAHRRFSRHGRKVGPGTSGEKLHVVRLDAKRLRYLLEFFRRLYPKRRIDPLIAALARVQDDLGRCHDAAVQADLLRGLASGFAGRPETVLVLGRLVERAERSEAAGRKRFCKRFRTFDARANRERVRRLFRAKRGPDL